MKICVIFVNCSNRIIYLILIKLSLRNQAEELAQYHNHCFGNEITQYYEEVCHSNGDKKHSFSA